MPGKEPGIGLEPEALGPVFPDTNSGTGAPSL
jgi:hypothetical protein